MASMAASVQANALSETIHISCNVSPATVALARLAVAMPDWQSERWTTAMSRKHLQQAVQQRNEVTEQMQALRTALDVQFRLTGKNPLQKAMAQEVAQLHIQDSTGRDAAGISIPTASSAAKSERLTPQAEAVLQSFFALQDLLSKEEAVVLAEKAGCEEVQVRDYFTRLRQNVRKFVAKLQHSASHKHSPVKGSQQSVVEGSSSATDNTNIQNVAAEIEEMDAAREASIERLQQLTGSSSLLDSPSSTGPLVLMMQQERSFEVRVSILDTILRTSSANVLSALAHTGGLIPVMQSWLHLGEADRQTSFLRLALQTLAHIPFPPALLHSSTLPSAVARLQHYRSHSVVAAATVLLQQWGVKHMMPSALASSSSALPAQLPSGTQPTTAAHAANAPGPANARAAGAVATAQPVGQGRGGAANTSAPHVFQRGWQSRGAAPQAVQRPLTADEIVKAKAKARLASAAGLRPPAAAKAPRPSAPAAHPRPAQLLPGPGTMRAAAPGAPMPLAALQGLASAMAPQREAEMSVSDQHNLAALRRKQAAARYAAQALEPGLQAAGRARIKAMQARIDPFTDAPPVTNAQWPGPTHTQESTTQQQRCQAQAEAVYVIDSLIPEAPAEPWGANSSLPAPLQPLQFMPFIPVDPAEAREQGGRLSAAGITLPRIFIEPRFTPHELGFGTALQPVQMQAQAQAHAVPGVLGVGRQALEQQQRMQQQQKSINSLPQQPLQHTSVSYNAPGSMPVRPQYSYQQQAGGAIPWGSMPQALGQHGFVQTQPGIAGVHNCKPVEQAPPIVTSNAQLQSILNAVQARSQQTQPHM